MTQGVWQQRRLLPLRTRPAAPPLLPQSFLSPGAVCWASATAVQALPFAQRTQVPLPDRGADGGGTGALWEQPPQGGGVAGGQQYAPGRVMVRFKTSTVAAATAAAQADDPLPGLQLEKLVGLTGGGGSAAAAAAAGTPSYSSLMLFKITGGLCVAASGELHGCCWVLACACHCRVAGCWPPPLPPFLHPAASQPCCQPLPSFHPSPLYNKQADGSTVPGKVAELQARPGALVASSGWQHWVGSR